LIHRWSLGKDLLLWPEGERKLKTKKQNVKLWNLLLADGFIYLYAWIKFSAGA